MNENAATKSAFLLRVGDTVTHSDASLGEKRGVVTGFRGHDRKYTAVKTEAGVHKIWLTINLVAPVPAAPLTNEDIWRPEILRLLPVWREDLATVTKQIDEAKSERDMLVRKLDAVAVLYPRLMGGHEGRTEKFEGGPAGTAQPFRAG